MMMGALKREPQTRHEVSSGADLTCISAPERFAGSTEPNPYAATAVCLETATKALRSNSGSRDQEETFFANPVLFHGHYIPGDVEVVFGGVVVATGHLERMEALTEERILELDPPPDALEPRPMGAQFPNGLAISPATAEGLLLERVDPIYPAKAQANHLQGTVVIRARIDKAGHVSFASLEEGPTPLVEPALEAVKQWRYKPYLVNGEAIEVVTTINVVFKLP
jgi:TonB family protein